MAAAPKPANAQDDLAMRRALFAKYGPRFTQAELRAFARGWAARAEPPSCGCDCHTVDDDSVLDAAGIPRNVLAPLEMRMFNVLRQIGADAERAVPAITLLQDVWGLDGWVNTRAERDMIRGVVSRLRAKVLPYGWCVEAVMGQGIRAHRIPGPVPCSPLSVSVRAHMHALQARRRAQREAQP